MYDKNFRVDALRIAARQHKIVGYSKIRKEALIEKLNQLAVKPVVPVAPKQEEQSKVAQELLKRVQGVFYATCSYAIEFENGTGVYHPDDVCHYRLNTGTKGAKYVWLCLNKHLKDAKDPVLYKKWVEWMLNESVFANLYDTKDVGKALSECVRVSAEHGGDQVYTAAVALREASEFSKKLTLWEKLCNAGVEKQLAWIVAQNFTEELVYLPMTAAHTIYDLGKFPQETFKNFFSKKKWAIPGKPYKEVSIDLRCHGAISGIHLYGDNVQKEQSMEALFEKYFNVKRPSGWGEKPTAISFYQLIKGTSKLEDFLKA